MAIDDDARKAARANPTTDLSLADVRDSMRASRDPRAERTRQAILEAVESLDVQMADEATVSGIVRAAGISRSSFYTHFSGIDELALTMLARAFDEIGSGDLALRQARGMTGAAAARAALDRLTQHLDEHRGLYVSVFGLPATSQAFGQAVTLYAEHAMETFALLTGVPAGLDLPTVATYIAGGTLTVLSAWLRSDAPAPREEVVALLFAQLPAWLAAPSGIDRA
ncbi:TetR/AcrR family transcriptional regulator [Frondihabitans cladoniiphilus]